MKKITISFIILIIVGIGGYFIFQKPPQPEPRPPIEKIGRCGDNICDEFEKANPNACPTDCLSTQSNQSSQTSSKTQSSLSSSSSSKSSEKSASSKPSSSSSSAPSYKESPFGFHPGNAENYSYIRDLGAKWSREGNYLVWIWIDSNRNGNYKFTQAEAPAAPDLSIQSHKINYDEQWLRVPENIKIMANVCPFLVSPLNKETGFENSSKELEIYQNFVEKAVERYDGDNDYGCAFSSPDCYKKDDNRYPSEETIKSFQKNPIKYWQVCNQVTETSKACKTDSCRNDYADTFASIQEKTYKGAKSADNSTNIIIAGDSSKELYPEVFKKLEGKYIDIIDLHRFGNNYNPKEDFDYIKSSLRSTGFDTSKLKFWMTETGTYSGDPSSDPDKNLPYLSEKQQAEVLVKIYVSALSYKIEKIFWAWNIVEGFTRNGGIFDYTGLVYDGCDFVNDKYECGSNIGYDKGVGVKKLGYYTYKKMVEILDSSDWNNIQTIQEKDGMYIYKFTKNGKPIWVAWNDNDAEKEITIFGINSLSVKITESVPSYSSGKEVANYNTSFKTETKQTIGNALTVTLNDTPVFVEEI